MTADIGKLEVGSVMVETTNNRGFTPEEVAERCLNRIVRVSEDAPPVIRDQALAYKKQLREVLLHYMNEAIKSDRTTVYNALIHAGHKDLADAIRRL
jgi:hypothetical protein